MRLLCTRRGKCEDNKEGVGILHYLSVVCVYGFKEWVILSLWCVLCHVRDAGRGETHFAMWEASLPFVVPFSPEGISMASFSFLGVVGGAPAATCDSNLIFRLACP